MSDSILVLSYDQDTRSSLSDYLTLEGYTAHEAKDESHALELARSGSPLKLILLDEPCLPARDSRFLQFRKSQPSLLNIPLILLTTSAREFKDPSVSCTLRKPLDLDTLTQIILRALNAD